MEDPNLAIVVEEERRVVHERLAAVELPRALRLVRRIEESAVPVRDEVAVELTLMILEGRRPLPAGVRSFSIRVLERELGREVESVEDITDHLPAQHVLGSHDRRARNHVHRRRDHVVVLAVAAKAHVGAVGKYRGITIGRAGGYGLG